MELIIYFQEMWQLAIQGQTQGIWFWAALYTFIVCVYSLRLQLSTRHWPWVEGDLSNIGTAKFGATDKIISNQKYVSKALYQYRVSGVDYNGNKVSPWVVVVSHNAKAILEKQLLGIQRLPSGEVKVYYKPSNPQKSFLIIAGKMGIFITLAISVLPLIGFYFKYYT